jgi:predicted transcriptional regulator
MQPARPCKGRMAAYGGGGWGDGRRVLLFAIAVTVAITAMAFMVQAPSPGGVSNFETEAGYHGPTPTASNLTYLYPAENYTQISEGVPFARDVLSRLDLVNFSLVSDGDPADPEDHQNQTFLPDGSYLNGPLVRLVANTGWASFRYSSEGQFLGFVISGIELFPSGPTRNDRINATRQLADRLNIPLAGDEVWSVQDEPALRPYPSPSWHNRTIVRVETRISGIGLMLGNSIVVAYSNATTYGAIRISIGAWYSAPWQEMRPPDALRSHAYDFLASWNETRDWTVEGLSEGRLWANPDEGSVSLVVGAGLRRNDRIGHADVWLDIWTGSVQKAWFADITELVSTPSPMEWWPLPVVLAAAGLVAAAMLLRFGDALRISLFALAFQTANLRQTKPIDNFVRGQIYGYILGHPGVTFSQLSDSLHLANGVLTYYLHVLEKEGFVRSRTVGVRKCFYPSGFTPPEHEPAILSHLQTEITRIVGENPWIGISDIARRLHIHRRTASYNVRRLQALGFLKTEGKGRRRLCAPCDASNSNH